MRRTTPRKNQKAFTFVDGLVVIVTIVLVATAALSFQPRRTGCGTRINCVSNLKQIGLAMRMFSNDHGDRFPFDVIVAEGGTKTVTNQGSAREIYMSVSNELNTPKVLTCNNDSRAVKRADFSTLTDKDVSYFVAIDADESKPNMILSGDRNLSTNEIILTGLVNVDPKPAVAWTKDIHIYQGNWGMADGSAMQVTQTHVDKYFKTNSAWPVRIVFP